MHSILFSVVVAAAVVQPTSTQTLTNEVTQQKTFESLVPSAPLTGNLVQSARTWALNLRERYSIPLSSNLKPFDSFQTRFGASLHFGQTVREIEVYGAKLVVTVDELNRVVQVTSSVENYAQVFDSFSISPNEAIKLASNSIPFPMLMQNGQPIGAAKPFLFKVKNDLHAGYLVKVQSIDLSKNWYAAIDALTGERLFLQNRVHHQANPLSAKVYPISPGGLSAGVGITPTVTRTLTFDDGGSMNGDTCAEAVGDGGVENSANDGGELCGTQLTSYNCCPTSNCQADAGAKRVSGLTQIMGFNIQYDIAVCARQRVASNQRNPSGTFEYTPVDPPTNRAMVVATDLANSDAFAEVHSFYHVNRVYDWMRQLSNKAGGFAGQPQVMPFKMRDERRTPAQKVAVWSNAMFPDQAEILPTCLMGFCRGNKLSRVDNAAFFPVENFAQLPIPGLSTNVDTLMIFQGNSADAAYDSTVIQHEFGHGAIYATANLTFDTISYDNRSANNESGALHEGFADFIAGAFNNDAAIGPYFGPRVAQSVPGMPVGTDLRNLDNTETCPGVLWGEVHKDSEHVSAALWKARKVHFMGTNNGNTYDAAFYAMLVSLTPNADFAMTAAAMGSSVARAFPAIPNATALLTAAFTEKGVIGCSKTLEVTSASAARIYYGIAAGGNALTGLVPGPFQFKIATPNGASKIRISGLTQAPQGLLGPGMPVPLTVLAKAGSPISFTKNGTQLISDATLTQLAVQTAAGNGALSLSLGAHTFNAACGGFVYVTIAASAAANAQNLKVDVEPLASCSMMMPDSGVPKVDAGVPDSGTNMPATDGGPPIESDAGVMSEEKRINRIPGATVSGPIAKVGCGCNGFAESIPWIILIPLLRRRKRS
jgi:Zn-dependent metalloprotease